MIYLYTLEEDITRRLNFINKKARLENEWIKIENQEITVKKGYSWNGASPKWRFGKYIIGTPEGKTGAVKYATLWHDAFYQFAYEMELIGISRALVDNQFYLDLLDRNFKFADLYYKSVHKFGWITWNKIINNRKND